MLMLMVFVCGVYYISVVGNVGVDGGVIDNVSGVDADSVDKDDKADGVNYANVNIGVGSVNNDGSVDNIAVGGVGIVGVDFDGVRI